MTKRERDYLWNLYSITNKLGGSVDGTAISSIALRKYKEAFGTVSRVISLVITGEDEEQCQRYIKELDALSRWNFGDNKGRISEEEKQINDRIKLSMNGWTPLNY